MRVSPALFVALLIVPAATAARFRSGAQQQLQAQQAGSFSSITSALSNTIEKIKSSLVTVDLEQNDFAASESSILVTSSDVVATISALNAIPVHLFNPKKAMNDFRSTAQATPYGSKFDFDDEATLLSTLFQGTSLARYLEPQADGSYDVLCSAESTDPAMQELFRTSNFNKKLAAYPSKGGSKLSFELHEGVLQVLGSPSSTTMQEVLGAVVLAEEVHHAALHYIDGALNYMVNTQQDVDSFLAALINTEKKETETLYAGVRMLSIAPTVVWEHAVSPELITAVLKGAILDFRTLYPYANIPQADLAHFKGAIPEVFPQIIATDFGFGTETINVVISPGESVSASKNNLAQLRLMIGLVHTDTFVWQQAIGADAFAKIINSKISGEILTSVVFPNVSECLDSTQDSSVAFAKILADFPAGEARTALEGYATWLATFREGVLGVLSGTSLAFSASQCMSVSTWI